MNYRLMRLSAAFLPAAMIAATLLGAGGQAADIFAAYMVLQLFAFCPAETFRNAAAREPGVKRVDQRFGGAVSQLLIGCLLLSICFNCAVGGLFSRSSPEFSFDPRQLIPPGTTAALIIFEQLFEERLYAIGRTEDGAILSAISCALLLTGMLMDASNCFPGQPFSLYGSALGTLIGLIFTLTAQTFCSFSRIPKNYGFVPKAFAQFMLYPAVCAAADTCLYSLEFSSVLTGWLLWRLARSYTRRSRDESAPLNLLLIGVCAFLFIGARFLTPLYDFALTAMAALLCAQVLYLAPSVRLYAGTALLIGAALIPESLPFGDCISIVLCLAAALLNVKNAFLRKKARPVRF